jgi:hypothetical protein
VYAGNADTTFAHAQRYAINPYTRRVTDAASTPACHHL